jgi:hypothetical protein
VNARRALALALLAAALPAQDVELGALASDRPGAREAARRALALAPVASLPLEPLERLLRHVDPESAAAAASILVRAPRAHAALRASAAQVQARVRAAILPALDEAGLAAALGDADAAVRAAALELLADRGALADAQLAAAAGDPDKSVAARALAIVLYERVPLGDALLRELSGDGRRRVLEALVEQPRASAVRWLRQLIAMGERAGEGVELLARAALPPAEIDGAFARELIHDAFEAQRPELAHAACARLPAAAADSLVGAVHGALQAGHPVSWVLPALANVSERGERHLLGIARALDAQTRETVLQWLGSREAPSLVEQVAAALDGSVALEPYLLRRAGPHLDSPARIERVGRLLAPDSDEELRVVAFLALLDGKCFVPAMVAFALEEPEHRLNALLQLPIERFPADALLELLGHERTEVRERTCQALATGAWPLAVQERLLLCAQDGESSVRAAARRALVAFGSEAAVRTMWATASLEERGRIAADLRERDAAWVGDLLRAELEQTSDAAWPAASRAELVAALAARGDRAAFDRLIAALPELPLRIVRRDGERIAAGLSPAHLPVLRRCLAAGERGEDALLEVLGWLAQRPDLGLVDEIRTLHEDAPSEDVRYEARRVLLAGAGAAPFVTALRARIVAGFDDDARDLAHEIVGCMRPPLTAEQLDLLARLVLLAPLSDPLGEAAQSLEGAARAADFPLHLPVVDLLRRAGAVDPQPFARVLEEARAHPARHVLNGRRLGHLLTLIAAWPELRAALGPLLARLALEAPDGDAAWVAPAELLLAEAAAAAGRPAEAAERYARAARGLLRAPPPPLVRGALLGERALRGPTAVALAAQPHLWRARAALAAGDRAAARAALALAEDLAVGDHDTRTEVAELREQAQ